MNRDFVGRLVGSGGAAVKKLKDEFNVRIEFIDKAYHGGWSNKTKKRKATGQTKVKITGRKENVEDAQNRLDVQIDKLVRLKNPNVFCPFYFMTFRRARRKKSFKFRIHITLV